MKTKKKSFIEKKVEEWASRCCCTETHKAYQKTDSVCASCNTVDDFKEALEEQNRLWEEYVFGIDKGVFDGKRHDVLLLDRKKLRERGLIEDSISIFDLPRDKNGDITVEGGRFIGKLIK